MDIWVLYAILGGFLLAFVLVFKHWIGQNKNDF